jgi:hypothetical protein
LKSLLKILVSFDFTKKTVQIQVEGHLICHFSDMILRICFHGLFAFGFASKGRLLLMPMISGRMACKA